MVALEVNTKELAIDSATALHLHWVSLYHSGSGKSGGSHLN